MSYGKPDVGVHNSVLHNRLARDIHCARHTTGELVNLTPTSPVRDKLTDVNMFLWQAQQALDEAIKLSKNKA